MPCLAEKAIEKVPSRDRFNMRSHICFDRSIELHSLHIHSERASSKRAKDISTLVKLKIYSNGVCCLYLHVSMCHKFFLEFFKNDLKEIENVIEKAPQNHE